MDQYQEDQSTLIRNLPKDNIRNPDEARIVQSIINDNVEEMNNPALMPPHHQGMQNMFMQDHESGMDMMPDFQNAKMPPGAMGGAMPMMEQPMPQQVPQMPMEQQQAMMHHQMMMQQQQAQQQAAAAQMAAQMQESLSSENEAWSTWLWRETKEPLVVSLIFFILSMHFVKILFANYVPYMSNAWINLLIRSVIAAVTVYAAKKFVL